MCEEHNAAICNPDEKQGGKRDPVKGDLIPLGTAM